MTKWWVSCTHATGQVNTEADKAGRDIIVFVPPVWRKFMGQPLGNLMRWLDAKFGTVTSEIELNKLAASRGTVILKLLESDE